MLETLFVNSALFKSITEICSLSISQHCFMSFKIMTSSGFVYRIILLANNPKNQHTCIRSVITKSYINLEIMFEMESKVVMCWDSFYFPMTCRHMEVCWRYGFVQINQQSETVFTSPCIQINMGSTRQKSWTQLIHVYHTQYQESGSSVTIETTQYTLASYKYKLNTLFVLCELLES